MIQINPEVKRRLAEQGIPEGPGLLYLICAYHELQSKHLDLDETQHVMINRTKIVERSYADDGIKLIWHVSLYENESPTETAWEWVEDWRKLFGSLRRDAIGSKQACYKKMKTFFANNPEIRKDEIIRATEEYLHVFRTGKSDVKYLQQADYFISKATVDGAGRTFNSRLELYLEIIKQSTQVSQDPNAQRYFKQVI